MVAYWVNRDEPAPGINLAYWVDQEEQAPRTNHVNVDRHGVMLI